MLKELGSALPPDLQPADLVRYGWIEPVLRIELPKSYYLSWENFPSLSIRDTIAEEDCWASHLWAMGARTYRGSVDPKGKEWYRHFLDVPDHWVTRTALAHQLPTDGSCVPQAFSHPGPPERTICPWIDFFAYWQAYHVTEILQAIFVCGRPRLPEVRQRLEALLAKADELEELAQLRLGAIRKRWERRREVFDWLSRLRTLLGIWNYEHPVQDDDEKSQECIRAAAEEIVRNAGLTVVDLMNHVRDHLLTLWREWGDAPPSHRSKLLLQQDIELAHWLVGVINGKPVPYDDPFWGFPADQMSREWAPLPSVLSFEADDAKREFPSHADIALSDSAFNQVVPPEKRLDEEAIEELTAKWWLRSAPFRRFVLAFDRLYRHYVGQVNEGRLVGLTEETPVEFLILCALLAEKLLNEWLHPEQPKGFHALVRAAAELVAPPYGVKDQGAFSAEVKETISSGLLSKTALHDLSQRPRNPFVEACDFRHSEPVARFLLKSFVNFAVLRNYSAHHDCIDGQLFREYWVGAGVEALMVVMLTILTVSPRPPQSA